MGKLPAGLWYWADHERDFEEQPLMIEGAWMRIQSKMWWAEERGKLTRNMGRWSKILGVSEPDAQRILNHIKVSKIGDVVTESNGDVTVTSRRMMRDEKTRKSNMLRQRRFRTKKPK
jgi:uncharacterized protein (UPF0218 family)